MQSLELGAPTARKPFLLLFGLMDRRKPEIKIVYLLQHWIISKLSELINDKNRQIKRRHAS
jgi:hypothetical protein